MTICNIILPSQLYNSDMYKNFNYIFKQFLIITQLMLLNKSIKYLLMPS